MGKVAVRRQLHFVVNLAGVVWLLGAPSTLWAQASLENPTPSSYQTGIGLIRGWRCAQAVISVSFDGGPQFSAFYGASREDTRSVCGHANTGFELLVNWNLLLSGAHTVRAFADGVEFAKATFHVTSLGTEFLKGAGGTCTAGDFPEAGMSTTLQWDESLQNFVVVETNRQGEGGVVETFRNPPEVASSNGVLEVTLAAEEKEIDIAGQKVKARVYNGLYIPPTLRVRPGDTMNIRIVNFLNQPTNLHHHGMNVSPLGNGDNVFLHVMPNDTFYQQIVILSLHPEGLLWYHPHMHGLVETQVFGGMSGGLIIEGILDPFPQLAGVK